MASSTPPILLSPLDQYMPRVYTRIFLIFGTADPAQAVSNLKSGLQRLNQHLPYLRGHVFQTDSGQVEIRWDPTDSNILLDQMPTQGSGGENSTLSETSFKRLENEGAPLHYFPPSLSPVSRATHPSSDAGAPVFAANYMVLDGGVVVGLSVQHNVMDGTGVSELVQFWAVCTRLAVIPDAAAPDPQEPLHRNRLLRLASQASDMTSQEPKPAFHELLARHSEFKLASDIAAANPNPLPPANTTSPPPKGASKVFSLAVPKLEATKAALRALAQRFFPTNCIDPERITTNTVLCAIYWSCITRIRFARRRDTQGEGVHESVGSKLGFAINGRTRLGSNGAFSARPFLGNVNLYGLAEVPVPELERATADGNKEIAAGIDGMSLVDVSGLMGVVTAISGAVKRVTPEHIVEVMELVEQARDVRDLVPGWDSFRFDGDVTITSWANMGVYEADFGEGIGRPEFMRVPEVTAVDGFMIVLPRKRRAGEIMEVVVLVRSEDLKSLEEDAVWNSYLV